MITELKLGIDSIKATLDLVKAVKGVTEKAEMDAILFDIREHLSNLQERLLNAQQVTDLILVERRQAVRELEDERSKNSRLERYVLMEPRPGIFLYVYQPAEGDQTPIHSACPNCFSDKTISPLQNTNPGSCEIKCPKCDFSYDPRTEEEIRSIYASVVERQSQRGRRSYY